MLGNEVARRVHAIRPALPVLSMSMSGYAQPILDTHGALASQIDLLEKPFTETTLVMWHQGYRGGTRSRTLPS
jgi:two-component system cell cycle sensor histidine kinase/response regulator CckA